MSNRNLNSPQCAIRQRGTVLVVALIVLIVMTVLGIVAMNSSVMQALMSTSYQSQTSTLALAENILREAQLLVRSTGGTGITHYAAGEQPDNLVNLDWTDVESTTLGGGLYVVDYTGAFTLPGESEAIDGSLEDSQIHVFRISTRGEGDRGGLRILQSVYVTLNGPED